MLVKRSAAIESFVCIGQLPTGPVVMLGRSLYIHKEKELLPCGKELVCKQSELCSWLTFWEDFTIRDDTEDGSRGEWTPQHLNRT